MDAESPKDGAAVRIFPPGVPLVTVLAGLGLQVLWPIDIGAEIGDGVRYGLGGLVIAAALLGLGLWPVVLFRRSGQSEIPWRPTTSIVERGPYRFTRNPMYLQMVVVCIGIAILLLNLWILILTPLCAWVLQKFAILPEEAYLERKFGDGYLVYKSRVRRWI